MKTSTRFAHTIQFFEMLLFLSGLLCAGGCRTAGSSIEVQQTPVTSLDKYRILAVDVTTKDPDFGRKEIAELTGFIVAKFSGLGKFEKAYATSAKAEHDADLKLSVVVQLFVNGEQDNAVFVNQPGSIDASVTLTDASNGNTLASAIVHSHTGSAAVAGISHAPTTLDTIELLSGQIVGFVTTPNALAAHGAAHIYYADYRAGLRLLTTNQARIWFYRPHSIVASAVVPAVKLDGTYVGTAVNGGFFCVTVAPGRHEVTDVLPTKSTYATVDVAGGSEAYVFVRLKPEQVSEAKGTKEIAGLPWDGN